jgi:hypothetical protein
MDGVLDKTFCRTLTDGTARGSKLHLMHVFVGKSLCCSLRQGDTSCENSLFQL